MAQRQTSVPLARLTSIRVGGWAREYYEPASLREVREVLEGLRARGETPFILGGGANTLFPDGEFRRPVVSTRRLDRWRLKGELLWAECGAPLGQLVHGAMKQGLSGLEGLVGIPGTIGGAIRMNAGGAGWDFNSCVQELGLLPSEGGDWIRRPGKDIAWEYRKTELGDSFVGWVSLNLVEADREVIRQRMRDIVQRKSKTQPLGQKSAGCVFRNPPGFAAGQLIDQLGLKGLAKGGARISDRHANFIVNAGGEASSEDVRFLMEEIRRRVVQSYGVHLEAEIVLA